MNVLYVSDSTTVSGAEVVLFGYLDSASAHGHRPFAYISANNPRLLDACRERSVPVTSTGLYSAEMIRTTWSPLALSRFARSFYGVAGEMAAVIRDARIDLIHAISYPASLYAAFASARTGIPQVWHEHNIKRIHPVNAAIYRRVSRTCRWIVGPSNAVTNNLGRAGIAPAKLRTVYNGIDLVRFGAFDSLHVGEIRRQLAIGESEQAVGLFGQMLPYKGHRTLIQAARQILTHRPNTRFYLVGALENPPYQQELQALIGSQGMEARFTFTGWHADVPNLMRAMDVVVVATTTPEPAALALMEAMAVERPVVASQTGGTAEIVLDGETGLLFPPGDVDRLADRVVRLLRDPELGVAFGRAGRRRVEHHFSRASHIDSMFGLYTVPPRPAVHSEDSKEVSRE